MCIDKFADLKIDLTEGLCKRDHQQLQQVKHGVIFGMVVPWRMIATCRTHAAHN